MRVKKLRVMIADDEPGICEFIRGITTQLPGLAFLPDAHDGKQALSTILTNRPDLAILDIQMPYLGGRDVLDEILRQDLKTRVFFLTAHNDPAYFEPNFWSGALGIFYKLDAVGGEGSERFVLAFKEMLRGLPYISPTPLNTIRKVSASTATSRSEEVLSQSEKIVLKLLVNGKEDKEIADDVGLSIQTVERRKNSMRRKLGVRSTSQLAAYAARHWNY